MDFESFENRILELKKEVKKRRAKNYLFIANLAAKEILFSKYERIPRTSKVKLKVELYKGSREDMVALNSIKSLDLEVV